MFTRTLGSDDFNVSALGLGCMGMSALYGSADEEESIATIHAAIDAGVTLLDTGDFYGMGANEMLIRRALRDGDRERVQLSVKFGALRDPAGGFVGVDTRPAAVKNFVAYSLQRLGTDHVDIYRPARLDPAVPIEETVGAIAELVEAGHVRQIGLSEIGADTLRRPMACTRSPTCRSSTRSYREESRTRSAACRELGVGVTAYGVLSRGLISGHWSRDRSTTAGDFRSHLPRFSGDNLSRNLELVEQLRQVAEARNATVAQVAIAWVLSRGDDIVPLIGARRRERLEEALGALELELGPDDLGAIEAAMPAAAAAGDRYDEHQMALLDSEKESSGAA